MRLRLGTHAYLSPAVFSLSFACACLYVSVMRGLHAYACALHAVLFRGPYVLAYLQDLIQHYLPT